MSESRGVREAEEDGRTARGSAALDRAELRGMVDELEAENRRLRRDYAQARHGAYRRTALGLFALGVVALAGAVVLPSVRTVLIALGGTGVFGGFLTYYLIPDRFIAADVGEGVYGSFADTVARLCDQLGLASTRVYVPTGGTRGVRLFVPQYRDFTLPPVDALDAPLVITPDGSQRGLSVTPSGAELFAAFEESYPSTLGDVPDVLVVQLTDAVVETFELATDLDADLDAAGGRVTFAPDGSAWGDLDRVDHPIPSLLAVGFAAGLGTPVELTVDEGERDGLVTLRWDADAVADERGGDEGRPGAGGASPRPPRGRSQGGRGRASEFGTNRPSVSDRPDLRATGTPRRDSLPPRRPARAGRRPR